MFVMMMMMYCLSFLCYSDGRGCVLAEVVEAAMRPVRIVVSVNQSYAPYSCGNCPFERIDQPSVPLLPNPHAPAASFGVASPW